MFLHLSAPISLFHLSLSFLSFLLPFLVLSLCLWLFFFFDHDLVLFYWICSSNSSGVLSYSDLISISTMHLEMQCSFAMFWCSSSGLQSLLLLSSSVSDAWIPINVSQCLVSSGFFCSDIFWLCTSAADIFEWLSVSRQKMPCHMTLGPQMSTTQWYSGPTTVFPSHAARATVRLWNSWNFQHGPPFGGEEWRTSQAPFFPNLCNLRSFGAIQVRPVHID